MENAEQNEEELAAGFDFLTTSEPFSEFVDCGGNVAEFDERAINDLLNGLNLNPDDEKDTLDVKAAFESSPWTKPFEELRAQMFCVNENLYKKIITPGWAKYGSVVKNIRTGIRYSGYWEFQSTPFDSTPQHGSIFEFRTAHEEVVEGLEAAVYTMKRGEIAHFVVSHKLLFGEENCPPGVQPCSDALLVLELVSLNAIINSDPQENKNNEHLLQKRATDSIWEPKRDEEKAPLDFETTMVAFLTSFKQNPLLESLKLPSGLTKRVIKEVDYMANKMGLRLTLCTRDLKTFTLWKNSLFINFPKPI